MPTDSPDKSGHLLRLSPLLQGQIISTPPPATKPGHVDSCPALPPKSDAALACRAVPKAPSSILSISINTLYYLPSKKISSDKPSYQTRVLLLFPSSRV